MSGRRSRRRTLGWLVGVAVWMAAVGGGTNLLWRYASTPGAVAKAPRFWPRASNLLRRTGSPTLVMVAHPRCPCTRASLAELAALLAQPGPRPTVHVLFIKPSGTEAGWEKSDSWHTATALPGVSVTSDEGEVEARRFGASTSGQVFLYDPEGQLLFSGGITGARGHVGDNLGRARVAALIDHRSVAPSSSPVFGCPLRAPTSER